MPSIVYILPLICLLVVLPSCTQQADQAPYQNPDLAVERRAQDLVSRMTLEEKVAQMVNAAAAIPRLGVPQYNWWNEALHGVARSGLATVFPQAIGLAATFDPEMMHQVAEVISTEARAKFHEYQRRDERRLYQGLTFWSPNINLFRDPRWGRGMETYGEDPYLIGRLAVSFITGMQGDDPRYLKTVATVKHFAVHSGPETSRHTFNAVISERDLWESYLPHFETSIREGKAYSVMCAYNRYQGEACCGSPLLLTKILREQWGFNGYVVSDCGAIGNSYRTHKLVATSAEASSLGIKSGCDLCCGQEYHSLGEAVKNRLLSETELDRSLIRLFTARFKLGLFDPDERVPYAGIPYSELDSPAHQNMALTAARKSMVLLKNERSLLPLKKTINSLAVIGPNADDVEVLLANYNGFPSRPVTPLQGLRDKLGAEKVFYSRGCDWAVNMPVLEPIPTSALFTTLEGKKRNGLTAEYFDNIELQGEPVFTRLDEAIDFEWWEGSPDPRLDDDQFSVRWTGELRAPSTGEYYLGGFGMNRYRIFLDDRLLLEYDHEHHPLKINDKVHLQAGQSYRLKVEYMEYAGYSRMQLLWQPPQPDLMKQAERLAADADAVVLCLGLSPRLEGEEMKVPVEGFHGGDRLTLDLPKTQQTLMERIVGLGKPTVLVLLNGSALAVGWADKHIPAILEAWYPGQAAGTAIADVLFGDYNPAGRLPVTFYQSVDQLPPFDNYDMQGHTYRFFHGEPLYPFGYGLSYSRFTYDRLIMPEAIRAGEAVQLSVDVRNDGALAGEEVVQRYVRDVEASVPVPIHSLQGVQRVFLQPGEIKTLNFTLQPRQLTVIDEEMRRVVEPGEFEISVGGKQPRVKAVRDAATTQSITKQLTVTGPAAVLP